MLQKCPPEHPPPCAAGGGRGAAGAAPAAPQLPQGGAAEDEDEDEGASSSLPSSLCSLFYAGFLGLCVMQEAAAGNARNAFTPPISRSALSTFENALQ